MSRRSLRVRIFLGMMLVIVPFVAVTYLVMDALVGRFLNAEIASSLTRARGAYERFVAIRNPLLLDKARSVARLPMLRTVLGTPNVDDATIEHAMQTLNLAAASPLIALADADGNLLGDDRGPVADRPGLRERPGVEIVLAGGETCGIWEYRGGVYLVAASPVTVGNTVLGLLALGFPLDGSAALDLKRVTGQDVTFVHAGRVLASGWSGRTEEGREPGLDSEGRRGVGRDPALRIRAALERAVTSTWRPPSRSRRARPS